MGRAIRSLLPPVAATLGAVAVVASGLVPQPARSGSVPLDRHPVIQYAGRPTTDRVAALNRALAAGEHRLEADPRTGYLRPVLEALDIPAESQLLVFSRTGVQRRHTGPRTPRVLYFDTSIVVGYIPGAPVLEIAAHDPQQGVVFYTLDQASPSGPRFTRQTACLSCHRAADTLQVPGLIARSHVVDRDGRVLRRTDGPVVDHRTPVLDRWGGWFVTGDYTTRPYAGGTHAGNVTATLYPSGTSLSNEVFIDWINSAATEHGYLSIDSDIAALMVFDHQAHAINLLTRLNWESRVAADAGQADFLAGRLGERVEELADYLLFAGEAPPPSAIVPPPGFARHLIARMPRDRHGRSLGELDLDARLLRYPLSYMIYTDAFEALPGAARDAVYSRLGRVLSGRDRSTKYAHLSAEDRRAILEILRDTKPATLIPDP